MDSKMKRCFRIPKINFEAKAYYNLIEYMLIRKLSRNLALTIESLRSSPNFQNRN